MARDRDARVEPAIARRQQADLALIGAPARAEPYAVEDDVAAVGRDEAAEDPQQRRLAGAVAPGDRHDLTRMHLELEAVERRRRASAPVLASVL